MNFFIGSKTQISPYIAAKTKYGLRLTNIKPQTIKNVWKHIGLV